MVATLVTVGLLIGGLVLSALVSLVLAFLPRRRRHLPRRPRWLPRTGRWARLRWPARRQVAPAPLPDQEVESDGTPRLTVPFGPEGPRAPLTVALGVAGVTGVVAGVVASPLVGLLVGAASLVALLLPRLRLLLGLTAFGCVVAAGGYVLVEQSTHHYMPGGNWPEDFAVAGSLTWAAVVFLMADAGVELVRRRQGRQGPTTGGPEPRRPGWPRRPGRWRPR